MDKRNIYIEAMNSYYNDQGFVDYQFIISEEDTGTLLCEMLLITGEIKETESLQGYYYILEETANKYNIKIPGI